MRLGWLIVLAISAACSALAKPRIDIATTTSVENSGLLEAILPSFAAATVRVHAAGSGRALELLADGDARLVISHAPDAEARYLASHPDWTYRKLAFNRFIVVGPEADPARVRDAGDIVTVFKRLVEADAIFVSRGDQSGTHERELSLWAQAGVKPRTDRLLVSGRGMAQALRHADVMRGYTLSDEATFWQLEDGLSLKQLFDRDPRLLNTYAVIYPRGETLAAQFAEWLLEGEGRRLIESYRVKGRPAFTPWQLGCPGSRPSALPCF